MRSASFRLFFACFVCFAGIPLQAFSQQEPASGPELAAQLRAAAPDEGSVIRGTLHIHAGANRTNIPIVCQVEPADASNSWRTVYDAGSEHLIVVHTTNGPNQYFYSTNSGPTNAIPPSDAAIPLAGSDFTLADLGLDFLHWPTQDLRPGEMRLGQPCYVLESSRPPAEAKDGITRVRSFIDKQSGGVIQADAYGPDGAVAKEFSLRGSFFRKVHGQWRLEKMEMYDRRKHSQTIIQFDIDQ
jgi:hypothetical protein